MDLLQQAAALMVVGMTIVFCMLIALIVVIELNARVVRALKLDKPAAAAVPSSTKAQDKPVAAIIAAAIQAHEEMHNDS